MLRKQLDLGTINEGAKNAVGKCMGLKKQEKVLIVTDQEELEVGNALRKVAEEITGASNVRMFVLEQLARRPLTSLPKQIEEAIPWANVTFWSATGKPGELSARRPFIRTAVKYARHGHMPNITPRLMEQGMCADYDEVYTLTHKIYGIARRASKIKLRSELGTDLIAEFESSWRWVPSDGRYHEKGKWGNLPEGETFTAPKKVNGHLVTNLLGDWFSEKHGNFKDPLSFDIKDSVIDFSTLECKNAALKKEILEYLSTDANSNRASEFALPTNPLLISLPTIGNLLQDEKARPHIAFGDPYPDETGATWNSKTHVDTLLEKCDAFVDGKQIMESGRYTV
jgi:aminopeptidase